MPRPGCNLSEKEVTFTLTDRRDIPDIVGESSFMLSFIPLGTTDNSPVVYCWDTRHAHLVSPVGTTEKRFIFANSIIFVPPQQEVEYHYANLLG